LFSTEQLLQEGPLLLNYRSLMVTIVTQKLHTGEFQKGRILKMQLMDFIWRKLDQLSMTMSH